MRTLLQLSLSPKPKHQNLTETTTEAESLRYPDPAHASSPTARLRLLSELANSSPAHSPLTAHTALIQIQVWPTCIWLESQSPNCRRGWKFEFSLLTLGRWAQNVGTSPNEETVFSIWWPDTNRTHVGKSCFFFSFLSPSSLKPVFVKPSVFPYLIGFARWKAETAEDKQASCL